MIQVHTGPPPETAQGRCQVGTLSWTALPKPGMSGNLAWESRRMYLKSRKEWAEGLFKELFKAAVARKLA